MKFTPPPITPGPWTLQPVGQTFKVGTEDMEAFSDETRYLAGEPYVAEVNDDFGTRQAHVLKAAHGCYEKTPDPQRVKANAELIMAAPNMAYALTRLLENVSATAALHDPKFGQAVAALVRAGYIVEA